VNQRILKGHALIDTYDNANIMKRTTIKKRFIALAVALSLSNAAFAGDYSTADENDNE
jgi:hypothetical protein